MDDTIAIMMPIWNRFELVKESIKSVYEQVHQNWRLYIYDDGSDEEWQEIDNVKKDKRVHYVRNKENRGFAYSMNRILALIKKDKIKYACVWGSDDICNIYRLTEQLKLIKKTGASLVLCCQKDLAHASKEDIYGIPAKIPEPNTEAISCGAPTLRVDKVPGWNEDIFYGEDGDLALRMFRKWGNIPVNRQILYFQRFHDERICAWYRQKGEWYQQQIALGKKVLAEYDEIRDMVTWY